MRLVATRSFIHFLLLMGGMLCAIWLRLEVVFGLELGADYQPWPPLMTVVLFFSALAGYGAAFILSRLPILQDGSSVQRQFRVLMLSAFIASAAILLFLTDVSQLQLVYFTGMTGLIGLAVILLPEHLQSVTAQRITPGNSLRELAAYNHLLVIWLTYRIEARYRQTLLGVLWIVLLPLSTALVLAFAFTQLLGVGQIMDVSFVAFLLSGQVIFSIFQSTVMNSHGSILGSIDLIKQIYFPRELMILLITGEALVDFFFMFVAVIGVNAVFYGIPPNIYYLLLPIPVLLMTVLGVGLALILGWVGLVVRDMQQLVAVVMQLLFFVTVLYSPYVGASPAVTRLMALNPFGSVVTAFRDILLYGRMPNWTELYFPGVLAVVLLYLGYVVFKVNEDRMVDMA